MNRPFRLRRAVLLWSLVVVTWLMATSVQSDESQTETVYDDAEGEANVDGETEEGYDTTTEETIGDEEYNEDTQTVGENADDGEDQEETERSAESLESISKQNHPQHHQQPQYYEPAPSTDEHKKPKKEKKKKKKVFVPVFVPEKEKKKMKIISVDKGFYIQGGTQLFGKFKSLKHCMKACAITPTCLSGDYNPWLHKCYQHSNFTACNTFRAHPQYVHFSKVPCSVVDAPAGRVTLGASMANGVEQKGIDSLQQCIKKCAIAGGGVAATATVPESFIRQACFAIDYDFATHKCFFFGSNVILTISLNPVVFYIHCPTMANRLASSQGTRPNPSVVHITFCPIPSGFPGAG